MSLPVSPTSQPPPLSQLHVRKRRNSTSKSDDGSNANGNANNVGSHSTSLSRYRFEDSSGLLSPTSANGDANKSRRPSALRRSESVDGQVEDGSPRKGPHVSRSALASRQNSRQNSRQSSTALTSPLKLSLQDSISSPTASVSAPSTTTNDLLDVRRSNLYDLQASVLEKAREIARTVDRMAEIQARINGLVREHDDISLRSVAEINEMLGAVREVTREEGTIRALGARLDMEERKVELYRKRLEGVVLRMEDVKEKEELWRERQSRRLRYLWAVLSMGIILWLLFSLMPPREPTDAEAGQTEELDPLAPELLVTEEDLKDISSPEVIFGLANVPSDTRSEQRPPSPLVPG